MPLANLERHIGANRVLQLVGSHIERLEDAVDVNLHAGGLGRTVVAHEDVIPLVRLHGLLGGDAQRIFGPLGNDVHAHLVLVQPQIPATVSVGVVHAGDESAGVAAAGELDPGADGETLVL